MGNCRAAVAVRPVAGGAGSPAARESTIDLGIHHRDVLVPTDGRAARLSAAADSRSAYYFSRVFICYLLAGWVLAPSLASCGQLPAGNGGPGQLTEEHDLNARRLYGTAAASTAPGTTGTNPELEKQADSAYSAPPDTTPYVRPVIPEDCAPQGQEAIPSDVTASPLLKQYDHRSFCSSKPNNSDR